MTITASRQQKTRLKGGSFCDLVHGEKVMKIFHMDLEDLALTYSPAT